jgi:hypothetical protein
MNSGGTVVYGGNSDEESRYISPTLISEVSMDDRIMKVLIIIQNLRCKGLDRHLPYCVVDWCGTGNLS